MEIASGVARSLLHEEACYPLLGPRRRAQMVREGRLLLASVERRLKQRRWERLVVKLERHLPPCEEGDLKLSQMVSQMGMQPGRRVGQPLGGQPESVATGVCLYEVLRQRRQK